MNIFAEKLAVVQNTAFCNFLKRLFLRKMPVGPPKIVIITSTPGLTVTN
jgi:hypothetical protein